MQGFNHSTAKKQVPVVETGDAGCGRIKGGTLLAEQVLSNLSAEFWPESLVFGNHGVYIDEEVLPLALTSVYMQLVWDICGGHFCLAVVWGGFPVTMEELMMQFRR